MLCMGIAIEILGYCNRNTIQAEGSDINGLLPIQIPYLWGVLVVSEGAY